ncbi:MAG: sigma-70 family RNA polymerase sigma factor [Planctomycetota bacterium]
MVKEASHKSAALEPPEVCQPKEKCRTPEAGSKANSSDTPPMPALDNPITDSPRSENNAKYAAVLPARASEASSSEQWTNERRTERVEQLIALYHADVFRYCYWICHARELAEDATQETFLRAFKGIHGLREMAAAKGWLLRIARNEVLRVQLKPRVTTTECEADLSEVLPDETIETTEWVGAGMAKLASEFRLVLMMYYFEHLSYSEIAQQLDIPIGTVMSRLNRAKTHLKQALESNR